jgi:hypothetical protein
MVRHTCDVVPEPARVASQHDRVPLTPLGPTTQMNTARKTSVVLAAAATLVPGSDATVTLSLGPASASRVAA